MSNGQDPESWILARVLRYVLRTLKSYLIDEMNEQTPVGVLCFVTGLAWLGLANTFFCCVGVVCVVLFWFLLSIRYNPAKKVYTVEDVDNEGDNDEERNHEVRQSVCLALPEEDQLPIPKGTVVLSVYPGTTSFYRGTIVSLVSSVAPTKQK